MNKLEALLRSRTVQIDGNRVTKYYRDRAHALRFMENCKKLSQNFIVPRPYAMQENVRGYLGIKYTGVIMSYMEGFQLSWFNEIGASYESEAWRAAYFTMDRAMDLGWKLPASAYEPSHLVYNPQTALIGFLSVGDWVNKQD